MKYENLKQCKTSSWNEWSFHILKDSYFLG